MKQFAITIENDKEIDRVELIDHNKPICGFERRKDKNYYKVVGDPRIITKPKYFEPAKADFTRAKVISSTTSGKTIELETEKAPPCQVIDNMSLISLNRFECQYPISIDTVLKFIKHSPPKYGFDIIQIFKASIDCGMGFAELHRVRYAEKIEIDKDKKTIKVWKFDGSKRFPDILLTNAIRVTPNKGL